MMRILLFTSSYAPNTGGLETVTRRLAVELAGRGHHVTVATNRYPIKLPSLSVVDRLLVHRQIYPDFPLRERPASVAAFFKMVMLLPLMPVTVLRLAYLVRRTRPDVVNIHYLSYPAAYALLVSRLMRLPIVLSFHGSDVASARRGTGQRWFLRWACRQVTIITTCSQELADSFRVLVPARGSNHVTVAHNGIDVVSPIVTERPNPYILVVARLVQAKGVDVAIRALSRLQQRKASVQLVIAGDGPMRGRLQSLACEEDVGAVVTFVGSLPSSDLLPLLQGALFCLVPSRREGFGMACLEAMAAGKAVIASRVGGIPEIVADGDTGLLVSPDEPELLADAIALLLESPDRALAMGSRGRQRAAQEFTWKSTVDHYLDAYSSAFHDARRDSVEERARV